MHSSSWCSAPPPAPRWLSWKMVAARLFSKIPTFMLRILPAWIVPLEIHPDLFFRTFCVAKKYKNFPLRCVGMFSQQTIRRVWSKVFLSEWRLGDFDRPLIYMNWKPSHSHQRVRAADEVAWVWMSRNLFRLQAAVCLNPFLDSAFGCPTQMISVFVIWYLSSRHLCKRHSR